jgi:hypothetical protein
MRLRSPTLICGIIFLSLSATVGAQTTREARLTVVQSRWDERLAATGEKFVVADAYPTEEALVFLSAYSLTRDPRYAEQAARQMNYAHSREKDGILVTFKGVTTRDYQARQIYNFYLAYRLLADGRYLRWADDCAAAMLRAIPRGPHTAADETHTTFVAGYFTADGKEAGSNGQVIDVNQNAEAALAYSLLYHDPASKFFRDDRAKEIAYEELLASMSIQDKTTGAIPLTDGIPGADTAYGSYATFSWVWCQLLWRDEKFEPAIRLAAKWLGPKMNLAKDSRRYYPTDGAGPIPNWEANYRLPLLWYCGVEARAFVEELNARERDPGARPDAIASNAPVYWAYFDLMGVPREFFLDANVTTRRP